jgi:hypothetical protein
VGKGVHNDKILNNACATATAQLPKIQLTKTQDPVVPNLKMGATKNITMSKVCLNVNVSF